MPVAIFSSSTFDAWTIDPATVTLAGAPIAKKGNGSYRYSFEDVNYDGLMDMVIHVDTRDLQLTTSSASAVLTGKIFDGSAIEGSDSVNIAT